MPTAYKAATVAGLALSAFALAMTAASSVQAGPIVPSGHYCMTWDIGGSDCSFTSYEQCLATAAALDAECYGLRDDRDSQDESHRGYNSRAQMRQPGQKAPAAAKRVVGSSYHAKYPS
ncbi:DUF3551 domain-containing protein [Bradyrhizobium lablabi]|uniref:DUF3551 domain-containing protein n=1 Tax=Bradyrhizobium lablabi TaxID=722472 RepID=UPI001BAC8DCE|nr:DUF3551 domain-containing protein [Bradyrhizobium lablabi]MBR1122026.1 DUF3551 domain-containing protein [Bradyrhizobium lablabi]